MKANGGVFVIDDFGRQRIRPRDLLNRWIVPLESRIDYLTLHTGKKFEVPFDVLIVFATNLEPEAAGGRGVPAPHPLQDLREEPDHGGVRQDLRAELQAQGHRLRSRHHRVPRSPVLRAARSRNARLPSRATSSSRWWTSAGIRTSRFVITRELLDQACKNYFLEEQANKGPSAPPGVPRDPATGGPVTVVKSGQRHAAARERRMAVLTPAVVGRAAALERRRGAPPGVSGARCPTSPDERRSAPGSWCSPCKIGAGVPADGPSDRPAAPRQRAARRRVDGRAPAGGPCRSRMDDARGGAGVDGGHSAACARLASASCPTRRRRRCRPPGCF